MTFGMRSLHIGPKIGVGIGGDSAPTLFGLIGDSQFAGADDPTKGDLAFDLATPNAGVAYNGRFAAGAGVDPPSWTNFDTDMVMRTLAPHSSLMGPEIVFGSTLQGALTGVAISNVSASGYLLADNWLPTATFMLATTGKNLFNTWVDRMRSFEASTGKKTAGVFVNLGGNDANGGAGKYGAFQTNMVAINAAIRAAFGAQLPIVWIRTHVNTAVDPTGVAAVRTAQSNVAAGDSRMALVDVDDLVLKSDVIHFSTHADIVAGSRAGFAMLDLLGVPRVTVTKPTVVGWGPADFGAGDMLPRSWGGAQDGDLEIMHVQTGSITGLSIPTPSGWTAIGTTTTTSFSSIFTTFNVYARELPAGTIAANNKHTPSTTVSIAGASRDNTAKIVCVRGPSPLTLSNIEAFSLWAENAAANPKTIPAINTLTNDALVLLFTGFWAGGASRAQTVTNGSISLVEYQDGDNLWPSAAGSALAITAGNKTTSGSTGTFTNTTTGASNLVGGASIVVVKA